MSLTKSQQNIAAMLAKAGRKVSVIDASDPRKPPIVQEFNHAPTKVSPLKAMADGLQVVMEDADAAQRELAALRAENNMLKGVLASHSDVRALLGELRSINHWWQNGKERQAKSALADLLRRFDRESQL